MLYTYYKWQIFGWFTQAKARFATSNQPTPQEIANKLVFRSVCTTFSLLRSLKLGFGSENCK